MKPESHRRLSLAAQAVGYRHLGDWLDTLSRSTTIAYHNMGDPEQIARSNKDFVALCNHAASVLNRLREVLDHEPERREDSVQALGKLKSQYQKIANLAQSVSFGSL
jgi:hypothetical protein